MTDLQIKARDVMEKERANLAAEDIKRQEIDVKSRDVAIKEAKLPHELGLLRQAKVRNIIGASGDIIHQTGEGIDAAWSSSEHMSNVIQKYAKAGKDVTGMIGDIMRMGAK